MTEAVRIEVEGTGFVVRFHGWHAPLEVLEPPGRLAPWSLGAHASALAGSTRTDRLDADAFSDAVLRSCWTGSTPGPLKLALWWAGGADHDGSRNLDLGNARLELRPWTFGSRLRALEAAGALDPEPRLDLARWLVARVAGAIARIDPEDYPIEALPAAPLLAALESLEAPADGFDVARLPVALRATILRVCKSLGWTPAQVLAAPASEIDRVLELLGEPEAPPPALEGLAAMTDGIVIHFSDEEDLS